MSAIDTAASRYDDALHRLDEVIKVIEDIPVNGLPGAHSRMAVRLLAEAYDLWRGISAARDSLTWG
ncbi:hypothetical protein [Actinophytocola algeriensis]|uniref:Uncharacterized protein n=1 Tax=Actinophytocola algeriensis TaxID=1768010 RepID=A0A7W7Q3J6_9PSEU|nr:hypothetical protein [Actinophytocola algeriensis]MBB4906366.1 hypothetical protein [Actinophytocola algeriensis]MBE1477847.1 hypothetical protein [Actinophytocola algeriensis]